jgi:hypothetical protein
MSLTVVLHLMKEYLEVRDSSPEGRHGQQLLARQHASITTLFAAKTALVMCGPGHRN